MKKRENVLYAMVLFTVLSGILLFVSQTQIGSFIRGIGELITIPLTQNTFKIYHALAAPKETVSQQKQQEQVLQSVNIFKLRKENQALLDQFQTIKPTSSKLLPAHIIGMPTFIPGVSIITQVVIDRGKKDNIKIGQAVIYKENVIGKVISVTEKTALIRTIFDSSFAVSARTMKTMAIGLIRGRGKESLLFDNVLLSDKLEASDIVITAGDIDVNNLGFPPDLIIGKITVVSKKSSDLFQQATIVSLIDIRELNMVFIYMP